MVSALAIMRAAAYRQRVNTKVDLPRPNLGIDPYGVFAPVPLLVFPGLNVTEKLQKQVDIGKDERLASNGEVSAVKLALGDPL